MAVEWEASEWAVAAVAGIGLVSGGAQLLFPGPLLARFGTVPPAPETVLLFAGLGVLTALFGGLLLHALCRPQARTVVFPWAALQKVVGAVLVVIAVRRGILVGVAGWGAALDGAAGLYLAWLAVRLRRPRRTPEAGS